MRGRVHSSQPWRPGRAAALLLAAGLALAGGSLGVRPSLRAATVGPFPNDAAALAPGIPLEQRRYLLYLYARVNKPGMAEALSRQILLETPGDKQTLLVLASMYIERKETQKALKAAQTLVDYFPTDHQALYFLGASYYLAGQYARSEEVLRELKLRQFHGKIYPYETDLASAALQAGDWYRAMLSYQELLRHHTLSEELRLKDREVLERIYREHLPEFTASETGFLLNNGLVYRSTLEYHQHLNDTHRIMLQFGRQDVKIDERPNLQKRWASNNDTQAGLESVFNRTWKTTLWAGGTETGARGSAGVTRTFGDQRFLELRFDGNERSDDGLLLESLDGRQHRVTANFSYQINQKWLAQGRVYARELRLGGQELGLSEGMNLRLEHILLHERPALRLGYQMAWMNFSGNNQDLSLVAPAIAAGTPTSIRQDVLRNLVLRNLHRQGVYAEYRDKLSGWLHYHGAVSLDYDVLRSSVEYAGTAGFSLFPRKSIEIRTEAGYSSSASTIDQGSDVWQFNIALNYWF